MTSFKPSQDKNAPSCAKDTKCLSQRIMSYKKVIIGVIVLGVLIGVGIKLFLKTHPHFPW